MTFHGATYGAGTTGTIPLTSDLLQASVNLITIPRGMAMKIWAVRMSGAKATIPIGFGKTAALAVLATATPEAVFAFDPTLDSWINDNLRHPIVIPSVVGGESVCVLWSNAGSVVTYVDIDVEFVPL
jgi:ABC-type spermidine/putrescine transport system permease subunit II